MVSTSSGMSGMSLPTNSSVDSEELSLLVSELQVTKPLINSLNCLMRTIIIVITFQELGYDAIRFASYRTAAKLRFIQTRSKCKC